MAERAVLTTRAVSIYGDEPMEEFLSWLQARWDELTPAQRQTAKMEARSVKSKDGLVMVGFKFIE